MEITVHINNWGASALRDWQEALANAPGKGAQPLTFGTVHQLECIAKVTFGYPVPLRTRFRIRRLDPGT